MKGVRKLIKNEKGQINLLTIFVIILGLIALLLVLPWFLGFRTVDAGEVAVVTKFGQVTGRVLDPGANWVVPFVEGTLTYNTKKVTYETASEEKQKGSEADYKDFPVDTNTEDGQPVDISYTVRFSVDPTKATWVAQNIGSEEALVEKVVKTESRIWARNVPRRYKAEDLYTGAGSQNVQNEIFDQLKGTFEKNGLILDTVGIREITFDKSYVEAIKAKQVEAVNIQVEENKAAQEKFRKEQRITQAEGQAREQELQRSTISPELLQKLLVEKWDGHYPQYMVTGSGAGQFILPLPGSR